MSRLLIFVYGVTAYLAGMAAITWLQFFIVGLFLPITINTGAVPPNVLDAAINLVLIGLFGLSHTVMARPGFKAFWTKLVPPTAERSTYVLTSAVSIVALILFWRPMSGSLWEITSPTGIIALKAIAMSGWALVVYATFAINHFDLFGLRHVWLQFRNRPYTDLPMQEPYIYRVVRHPMQLGILIGIWVTPHMTIGHLLMAMGLSLYIAVGLFFEERDLIRSFGEQYRAYRKRTPAVFPSFSKLLRA